MTTKPFITFNDQGSMSITEMLIDKQLILNLNPYLRPVFKSEIINRFGDFVKSLITLSKVENRGSDRVPCFYVTLVNPITLEPVYFCTGAGYASVRADERNIIFEMSLENYQELFKELASTDARYTPHSTASLFAFEGTKTGKETMALSLNFDNVASFELVPHE